jgi:hypothetical protein
MSRDPNPIDDPELYESLVVDGVRSPGKVTFSGHDRTQKWDVQSAPGQSGATTQHKGEDPADFTASFYFARDPITGRDGYEEWPKFKKVLEDTISGPKPKAKDCYHPDLAENRIKAIVLKKMGGRTYDGKGGCTIAVQLGEYRPPKPKGGTPKGASANKPKEDADPNAAANAELKRLREEYQKL